MKIKPERPDFSLIRERAEGGFGAHPSQVLWLLDMLEEAEIIIGDMGLWVVSDTWFAKYRGDNDERNTDN